MRVMSILYNRMSLISLVLLITLTAAESSFPENVSDFDPENAWARGIILVFQRWPDEKEKTAILEKTSVAGLEKTTELPRFKAWIFTWPEWQKGVTALSEGVTALSMCDSLVDIPPVEYCEPDYYLVPADGK